MRIFNHLLSSVCLGLLVTTNGWAQDPQDQINQNSVPHMTITQGQTDASTSNAASASAIPALDAQTLNALDLQCAKGEFKSCNYLVQFNLAQQQYATAATYLEKLCYSQDPNASQSCAALTALLMDESYKILDINKALTVAKHLCEDQGIAFGCIALSQMYVRPDNKDFQKAMQYAEKACDLEDATGCKQIAISLYTEAYAEKDEAKAAEAFDFYKRACDLGDTASCKTYEPHKEKLQQFHRYVTGETGPQ